MSSDNTHKPGTRRPRTTGKDAGSKKGRAKGRGAQISGRQLAARVKTAKGRKLASTRWLKRQLNDPYVAEAQRLGYRSRAAFKLSELDDRFQFLVKGARVVDLGAAPGGWSQVAVERTNVLGSSGKRGRVVGLDIQEMDAIPGAELLQGDFMDAAAFERLLAALNGPADIVLSDMAAGATGHPATDHLRIMGLLEAALDFAARVLAPGGTFVGKVLKGGTENELLIALKRDFRTVRHAKPPASRDDSAESYVVAQGFRGNRPTDTGTE